VSCVAVNADLSEARTSLKVTGTYDESNRRVTLVTHPATGQGLTIALGWNADVRTFLGSAGEDADASVTFDASGGKNTAALMRKFGVQPSSLAESAPERATQLPIPATGQQTTSDYAGFYTGLADWIASSGQVIFEVKEVAPGQWTLGGIVSDPTGNFFILHAHFDPKTGSFQGTTLDAVDFVVQTPIKGKIEPDGKGSFSISTDFGRFDGKVERDKAFDGLKFYQVADKVVKDPTLCVHQNEDSDVRSRKQDVLPFTQPGALPPPTVSSGPGSPSASSVGMVGNSNWALTEVTLLERDSSASPRGVGSTVSYHFEVGKVTYRGLWNATYDGNPRVNADETCLITFGDMPRVMSPGQSYSVPIHLSIKVSDQAVEKPWYGQTSFLKFNPAPVLTDPNMCEVTEFGKTRMCSQQQASVGQLNGTFFGEAEAKVRFHLVPERIDPNLNEFDIFEETSVVRKSIDSVPFARFHYVRNGVPMAGASPPATPSVQEGAAPLVAQCGSVSIEQGGKWVKLTYPQSFTFGASYKTGKDTRIVLRLGDQYWLVDPETVFMVSANGVQAVSGETERLY